MFEVANTMQERKLEYSISLTSKGGYKIQRAVFWHP